MKKTFCTTLLLTLISGSAFADRAASPDVTLLLDHTAFANGASNNLGPAIRQTIDSHWTSGICTDSNGYEDCDALRFGMSIHADATCIDSYVPLVTPTEDGGSYTKSRIQTIHREDGSTFCDDTSFVPHDTGLLYHGKYTFPEGVDASEEQLTEYWERPRLSLMVVGEEPQTSNSQDDDRVIKALQNACDNLWGHGGVLPAMPTWVMMARKSDDNAGPYANLLAAAGGTATCCYGDGCSPAASPLDVCSHILDGRTDSDIRSDLKNGKYSCGDGDSKSQTGMLDFGGGRKWGQLPQIRCHLVGESNNDNCETNGREDTDLLGMFACIRQLPYGVSWQDATIEYCETEDDCVELTEDNGGIEWVDPNKTMFLVTTEDGSCDVNATVNVVTCEADLDCVVPGAEGRCAVGKTSCDTGSSVCEPLYEPMPEICNGLDDDCDGQDDNMSDSWENFEEVLPTEHEGLDCFQDDICGCPSGGSDEHAGDNFEEYLANWSGACVCGSGLEGGYSEMPEAEPAAQPKAACSATANGTIPFFGLLMMLLGLIVGIRNRRKD